MPFCSAVLASSSSMVVKPIRRSSTLHLPSSFFAAIKNPLICTPLSLRAGGSTPESVAVVLSAESNHSVAHGPCLDKGRALHGRSQDRALLEEEDDDVVRGEANEAVFDESVFTRVYDISAIRVPRSQCLDLENRLRGHLLNWPRVRNIARVPGDDMEEGFEPLFGGNAEERKDSLNKQLYNRRDKFSPILHRENLMKTFNSLGYLRFKEVAELSSPKMSKKKKRKKYANYVGKREKKMDFMGNVKLSSVEVVDNGEEEVDNMRGLLGDEFMGSRWRGPTRLLLLDERYSNKTLDEMPGAIKALFNRSHMEDNLSSYQLVRCKLTLFYDYWQMNEVLAVILPKGVTVPSAFETVGHVAILNLQDEHLPNKKIIAQVVLSKNKQRIGTVVNKIDPIHNDYRTTHLEVLAGNRSLVAAVVENGMRFIVDLSTAYWNSRFSTERQRLVSCFGQNDIVCDVFSGVGPIAIFAAMKVKRVYANDLNPHAVEYLERNIFFNKVNWKVQISNMDGRRFIHAIFTNGNAPSVTQVVMDFPDNAAEFLDAFRGIFKRLMSKEVILPRIHIYGFSKAKDPEFDFRERIKIALSHEIIDVVMRRVLLVDQAKWMLYATFILPEAVAFARTSSHTFAS